MICREKSKMHIFLKVQILPLPPQLAAALKFGVYPSYSSRASWVQVKVAENWPALEPSTNYWVVVAPSQTLYVSSSRKHNGMVWTGINITKDTIPDDIKNDNTGGNLFTARELNSQLTSGDLFNSASRASGLYFGLNTRNWGSIPAPRFTNWHAQGSVIRYGLQVLGIQRDASPSILPSPAAISYAAGAVSTIAGGNGFMESGCDDGIGTSATFNEPSGVALVGSGAFAIVVSILRVVGCFFLYAF